MPSPQNPNCVDVCFANSPQGIVLPKVVKTSALEHIKRLRGGSQPMLMRCADSNYYVVKFQNNPQGIRVLANDFMGSELARVLGLSAAIPAVVDVKQVLIELTPGLVIEREGYSEPCRKGLSFGSRYSAASATTTLVDDFLPPHRWEMLKNQEELLGTIVFDVWTHNADPRQFVFAPDTSGEGFRALMIDQGWCFNGAAWNFPDTASRLIHIRKELFSMFADLDCFDFWLDRLENRMTRELISAIAARVPCEWYENDTKSFSQLVSTLDVRRKLTRGLLRETWKKNRDCFANCNRNATIGAIA